MGSSAHITIINKTKYRMVQTHCHSYQMNEWNFPTSINAGTSSRFEIEWCENIFKTKSDDAGEAYYGFEGDNSKRVEFAMWNAKQYNFTFKQIGFEGIDPVAQRITWVDDGEIIINIEEKSVDPKTWMKFVDDNTPFNKMSIPGTHDTLTFAPSTIGSAFSRYIKTQDADFVTQLNYGCRYFDIRVDKNMQGCHGTFGCKNSLWDVMNWLKDFLTTNRNEAILMRLKTEGSVPCDKALQNNVDRLLNAYSGIIWRNNLTTGFPLLKDVRGKIIILDNFTDHPIFSRGYGYIYDQEGKFDTQDNYKGPDEDKKLDEIEKNIDLPYNPEKMKINHVSATGKTGGFLGWSPRDYAEYENPRVVKFLAEKTSKFITGALIFDFVDDRIAHTVISGGNYFNS